MEENDEMKSKVPLRLHFDGPGVDSHTMRVQELAPALLSLNKLVQNVNTCVNGDSTNVQLYIKAFKSGSFGIDLFLDTSVLNQVIDFLNGRAVTALINGTELAGLLLALFKLKAFLKGEKPLETRKTPDDKVELILENRTIIVEEETFNVYFNHPEIPEDLNNVVAPLGTDGINEIEFSTTKEEFKLTKEEYKTFVLSPSTEEFSENLLKNIALQIKSPYFEKEKKWKVLLGDQYVFVSIKDQIFMKKVLSGEEEFCTGDVLVADVLMTQSIENNKIVSSYVVEKVIEHKKAPRQLIMKL